MQNLLRSSVWRVRLLVFAVLFASFGAFASGLGNHNTLSRMGLTANFVQHGRLDIEGYAKLTNDRAVSNGKYYSDKAPGMSFLAMPAAWAFTRFVPVSSEVDFHNPDAAGRNLSLLIYVSTLLSSGLLVALAGAMLFDYVRRETNDVRAATAAAIAYGLATPTWAWATSFFGHSAAGALLLIGFITADQLTRAKDWNRRTVALMIAAGAALGWAMEIEFTAALPVAIILSYLGFKSLERGRPFKPAALVVVIVGLVAAAMLLPLLAYNNAVFGSPFKLGYSNVVGWDGMKTGIFGINAPDPAVLVEILFGFYRGIIWISPVVFFAAGAAVVLLREEAQRLRAIAILAVTAFYLAVNAGYAYWDGGSSTGPRHITPLFPFLAIALGLWLARASRPWRNVTYAALSISVLINLAIVSVETMAPATYKAPLTQLILPEFLAGDLPQSMVQIILHRTGLWQLLPLLAVWAGFSFLLWRELTRARTPAAAAPNGS